MTEEVKFECLCELCGCGAERDEDEHLCDYCDGAHPDYHKHDCDVCGEDEEEEDEEDEPLV